MPLRKPGAARAMSLTIAVPVVILLLVAWLLYRPELVRPFDYVDFPENILILKQHDGFVERFRAISSVYAEHGRFSPITLGSIAAQWTCFEWWTPGWQLFRFVMMSSVVVMAYALFRKLHLTAIAAFAATSLLITSPGAVVGWTRLSTAEPLGMVWLLIACHLALRRPTMIGASLFALMLLATLWTKEIMAAAFLFPLLLANQRNVIAIESESPAGANPAWYAPSAVALLLGAVPIIHTWNTAPLQSFAGRYGSSSFNFNDVAGSAMSAWFPFAPIQADSLTALLVVVFAFLLVVVIGWREALALNPSRRRHALLLMMAIVIPVAGALVYAPWPFYLLVYALPFTIAGALLFGQATSSLLGSHPAGRLTGAIGMAIVLTFCLAQAANESGRTHALRQAFATTVTRVANMADVDTALVGIESGQFDSQGNFGPRFRLYAEMMGLQWPPVRDVVCDQLPATPPNGLLVLRLNLMCDPQASPPLPVVTHYARLVWPSPLPRPDSVMVTLTSPPLRDSLP